jgi:hypothetical protein
MYERQYWVWARCWEAVWIKNTEPLQHHARTHKVRAFIFLIDKFFRQFIHIGRGFQWKKGVWRMQSTMQGRRIFGTTTSQEGDQVLEERKVQNWKALANLLDIQKLLPEKFKDLLGISPQDKDHAS